MTNALQTGIIRLGEATEAIRVRLRKPQKVRALELFLLILAWAVSGSAIALVQLGALETIDLTILYLAGGIALLTLVVHIVLRVVAREADPFILPIATVLNGLGIAMIYRIDIAQGLEGWAADGVRQVAWTGLAIVAAIVVLLVIRNHRILTRYRYLSMFAALALMLLPMVPGLGATINEANVWIRLGAFSFQPGELAKIFLAIFFAGYLMTARESLSVAGKRFLGLRLPRMRDLGPIFLVWVACMLILVVQGDLGTGMLYFGLFTVMIYVATGRREWILIGLALIVIAIGVLWVLAQTHLTELQGLGLGRAQQRIEIWLNPFDDELYQRQFGGSYQVVQGLFGMANGGLFGTGFGLGRPNITPQAKDDYIIASFGEELGLVGIFAILALFLILVTRGMRVGFRGPDDFTKLLGVGLAFTIALQLFVVVGGVTRVIPMTGLTIPFMASGGSSLLANWIIVALLLRLSDSIRSTSEVTE
ncbi:MAG TPA: FtsW/RodA/SpoVE family cell cycle protein [Candidatus Agrococcus pullicola]|uniref:FtsW/RodA/SpoVE family cell cycle protein n=1 Tax=Candidatus Agrococcus pullicola TaxID=2838429 RepID=A0A9D1YV67_9MICO|nr:FtsW/RodA/SpoVE family cell cycle protein [Candidatus Agrococcus pullicola]